MQAEANGTLTKSIGRNEDGEVEITMESSGTHPVGGARTFDDNLMNMNQTIVVEATPLESVEAFGMKASSANIWWGVLAIIVLMAAYKWLKR